jgi:hypothetical protein
MSYWLIYYDDFSNSGWTIKSFACFYSEEEAQLHLKILWNDEDIWWHLVEVINSNEIDPIFIVTQAKSS